MTGANEKYTTKRYINVHIAFIIQKSLECVWHVENIYLKVFFSLYKKRSYNCSILQSAFFFLKKHHMIGIGNDV